MRVLTWNCRRAQSQSGLWDHVREVAPDIALLQEVAGLPRDLAGDYEVVSATPPTRAGRPQRFRSAMLVKGTIVGEYQPTAAEAWVAGALRYFGGTLLGRRVRLKGAGELTAVCVHSPAWPVPRTFYAAEDVTNVKLPENSDIWVTDLLVAGLRAEGDVATAAWLVAGDFNACETFDRRKDRGNRRWLDRMSSLGLVECVRHHTGTLTPTFRRPGRVRPHCQIDYLFASRQLSEQLTSCRTGDPQRIFGAGVSDHLPIVADFSDAREA